MKTDELIVGFMLLGVFATVLKPTVLPGDPTNYKAIAQEAASMVAASFQSAQQAHRITSQTGGNDLTPYMNYVVVDTNETFTNPHTPSWLDQLLITLKLKTGKYKVEPLQPCNSRLPCLKLHNGSILQYDANQTFGKVDSTHALVFNLDPDGPGQLGRITFYQYASGQLTTGEHPKPNTITAPSTLTIQTKDPDYLPNWN